MAFFKFSAGFLGISFFFPKKEGIERKFYPSFLTRDGDRRGKREEQGRERVREKKGGGAV